MKKLTKKQEIQDLKNDGDFDFVEIPHDEHEITIWFREGKFFLEFNAKFIKMAKTVKPIFNKLDQLVTTW